MADERELLLAFVQWKREIILEKADGLSEDQLRWTPPGGLVPLIGIMNHVTHMEWRWVNGRYLCEPFPERTEEWVVPTSTTYDEVRARYVARAAETARIVRAAPSLDEPLRGREGDGPALEGIFGWSGPANLRYCVLHLIEETAHHAGHADATRELLDAT